MNIFLPKELIIIILKRTHTKDLINTQILSKNENVFNLSLSLKIMSKGYNFCYKNKLLLETELSIYCKNIHIGCIMNYKIKKISQFELKHIININKNNLEYETKNKYRLIHYICIYQGYNILKYILEKYKINLECETDNNVRPIHDICRYQGYETIKYILENYKIDLECANNNQSRPIHNICRYQDHKTIKYILENYKIDLGCANNNKSRPIHFICKYQNSKTIKYILENYVIDLECFDNYNSSPFHMICFNSDKETIEYVYINYISKMNKNSINNILNKVAITYIKTGRHDMNIFDILKYREYNNIITETLIF
jgi:hypothetical protein